MTNEDALCEMEEGKFWGNFENPQNHGSRLGRFIAEPYYGEARLGFANKLTETSVIWIAEPSHQ